MASTDSKLAPDTEEEKTEQFAWTSERDTEPLSERALDIKQTLQSKKQVKAVLLKPNGESEEIEYDSSSKTANQLLKGRPTIIGELDEAQIVIARAMNQSTCGTANQHTLPAPFASAQFNGNYLLFRVDATGSTIDLSLKEYADYVAQHKDDATKARDLDSTFIKSQCPPTCSNSRLTLLYLRSEIDQKVRAAFEQQHQRNPKESEIAELIDAEMQKLIDGLVFKTGASPLSDPDYKPEDEDKDSEVVEDRESEELEQEDSAVQATGTGSCDASSEGDWRSQLNDALTLVRERGRFDGMRLAEKISSTLYEVNGVDPSLAELADVFRKIQTEFAYEAQEELLDDADTADNGSAFYLRNKSGKGELQGADLVEYATRIVGEDLLSRARSAIAIGKGRGYEPSEEELRETVLGFAVKMAEGFQVQCDEAAANDEDPDYNPNNTTDQQYAVEDAVDDMDERDSAPLNMSKSATVRTRQGNETYSVYFGDAPKAKKSVADIVAAFVGAHGRQPNALEKDRLCKFVAMKAAPEKIGLAYRSGLKSKSGRKSASASATRSPSKVLVTPIKEKKTSQSKAFSVYFEKTNPQQNEVMAVKWFERFNERTPTDLELHGIRSFTKADSDTLREMVFAIEDETETGAGTDDSKRQDMQVDEETSEEMSVTALVTKAKSTRYNLDFECGDEQEAIKWFERFNQRKPDAAEMHKISQFVEEDHAEQETIDVD